MASLNSTKCGSHDSNASCYSSLSTMCTYMQLCILYEASWRSSRKQTGIVNCWPHCYVWSSFGMHILQLFLRDHAASISTEIVGIAQCWQEKWSLVVIALNVRLFSPPHPAVCATHWHLLICWMLCIVEVSCYVSPLHVQLFLSNAALSSAVMLSRPWQGALVKYLLMGCALSVWEVGVAVERGLIGYKWE